LYVALLCLVTLVAGFLGLRRGPGETSMAIRVGAAGGASPAANDLSGPQTPSAAESAAVSLNDLAQDLRTRPSTPPTRLGATVTTRTSVTTTTTSRPATTTTAKPAPVPAQPAAPPPTVIAPLTPLTTLLDKVVPPAVAVAGALTRTDSGVASWFNAPDATCAHRTLPMGTVVKVTRTYNGASASCKVSDRGPTVETGRLIDLSLDTFQKLASKDAGLIDVRIEW